MFKLHSTLQFQIWVNLLCALASVAYSNEIAVRGLVLAASPLGSVFPAIEAMAISAVLAGVAAGAIAAVIVRRPRYAPGWVARLPWLFGTALALVVIRHLQLFASAFNADRGRWPDVWQLSVIPLWDLGYMTLLALCLAPVTTVINLESRYRA